MPAGNQTLRAIHGLISPSDGAASKRLRNEGVIDIPGTLTFDTIHLLPHSSAPAKIDVIGDVNFNSLDDATAAIINGAGAGSGNAQISGGVLNLDDNPNTNGEPSLAREADLLSDPDRGSSLRRPTSPRPRTTPTVITDARTSPVRPARARAGDDSLGESGPVSEPLRIASRSVRTWRID